MKKEFEYARDNAADEYAKKIAKEDSPSGTIDPVNVACDFKSGADFGYAFAKSDLNRMISIAQEALAWAEGMFIARDEMNAKIHCSPVQFSPITERIIQARKALEGKV